MSNERGKTDPENYRAINVPMPVDDADRRLSEFFEELYDLRNKYRLPDVYVAIRILIAYEDGSEGHVMSRMIVGSEENAEAMTAWALGYESAQRQARITRIIDAAASGVKVRKSRQ